MLEILKGTPIWAYVVFVLLASLGLSASKARARTPFRMMMVPLVFLLWSMATTLAFAASNPAGAAVAALALVLGGFAGYALNQGANVQVDPQNPRQMILPGTWMVLILSMALFALHYWAGYERAVAPEALAAPAFRYGMPVLGGGATGYFAGQALAFWRRFRGLSKAAGAPSP
jgi:hypothetical protein